MSASVTVDPSSAITAVGLKLLFDGIKELNYSLNQKKCIKNENGIEEEVEYVISDEQGNEVGIKTDEKGNAQFIEAGVNAEASKNMANKMRQIYSQLKVLQETKKKGYKKVKQEILADGSIRIVVQKWQ